MSASFKNTFISMNLVGMLLLGSTGLAVAQREFKVRERITEEKSRSSQTQMPQKSSEELAEEKRKKEAARKAKKEQYRQMVQDYESREAIKSGKAPSVASKGTRPANLPKSPLGWVSNNNWQRVAEIKSGNVTFLRRSTNEPAAPDETVILRWRTPDEHARRAGLSSKRSFPNRPRGPLKQRFEEIAAEQD